MFWVSSKLDSEIMVITLLAAGSCNSFPKSWHFKCMPTPWQLLNLWSWCCRKFIPYSVFELNFWYWPDNVCAFLKLLFFNYPTCFLFLNYPTCFESICSQIYVFVYTFKQLELQTCPEFANDIALLPNMSR